MLPLFINLLSILHLLLAAANFRPSVYAFELPGNERFLSFLMFGDSLVDTGTNNYLLTPAKSNFPPYGRDFLDGKPTGRFSNGKVPADLFVEALGIKELLPPFRDPFLQETDLVTGVNFASAGSGFDPLTAKIELVMSMADQVNDFVDYKRKITAILGEAGAAHLLDKTLIAVAQGTNDLMNSFYLTHVRKLHFDIDSYTSALVSSASSFFKLLYRLGGRRILVINTPPVGCLPIHRFLTGGINRECREKYNIGSRLFNDKLAAEIMSINAELRDVRVVGVDIYIPVMDMIQDGEKYGFRFVKEGCCGTGTVELSVLCNKYSPCTCTNVSEFMFWDSAHPTERAYRLLVNGVMRTYRKSFL